MTPEAATPARGAPKKGSRSLSLGRIAGIPVRVHWTFWLLIPLVVLAYVGRGWHAVVGGLAWVVVLFVCVTLHEISHCLVARRLGVEVMDILLVPIGGFSELSSMPDAPEDELAVAVVGPLTSLALGLALLGLGVLAGAHLWPPTLFAGSWLARLAWLNLLLGAFNLLPALPMDGGRVLRAALERHRGHLEATVVAARVARWVGAALLIVGLAYDVWLVLIAVFVLMGASAEEADARRRQGPSSGLRRPRPDDRTRA